MDILKELKNNNISQNLLNNINSKANFKVSIMEVCGTHTNVILKSGLKDILTNNINLINGPGCPVCVTPQGYVDTAIELSKRNDVIITTFGDLIRVPGSQSNLAKEKAKGRDIRVVYSPLDSIKIAKENSDKEVVFLSIGFETTAPIIALSIKIAKDQGIKNYSILNSLKTMPEAMKALVLNPDVNIDAFLCPGNVATIIGEKPFVEISNKYKIPMVISGFEVNDILASIYMLIEMRERNEYGLVNLYSRLVKEDGNKEANKLLNSIFTSTESTWRGLGKVNNAGLELKDEYRNFDVLFKFRMSMKENCVNNGCSCGDVLIGIKEPTECKLFGSVCTPLNPIGACMVSEEGACSAFYKYR
ncbi:hydrogenase formation protein HypD [Clostridium sp.]|uniref:hydrogenase formation protein HypD n=1 Tax=Clostridium sp. TaxID=1506 RepID=UPI001B641F03|nr:hydrogenase formation protein HypD [Clostridium sp.]MBP3915448.1 hydrogenase formation protein HypD [Clostridium sp.]